MAVRIALRTSGKKVTPYLTSAGSVARMKRLQDHPKVKEAQRCLTGNDTFSERKACLKKL